MKCLRCGHENRFDDARFCSRCGASLSKARPAVADQVLHRPRTNKADLLATVDPGLAGGGNLPSTPIAENSARSNGAPELPPDPGPGSPRSAKDWWVPPAQPISGAWPLCLETPDELCQAANCRFIPQGVLSPLVEVALEAAALLTFRPEALVWSNDLAQIDTLGLPLRPLGGSSVNRQDDLAQAYGPGLLALTAGIGCTALPIPLSAGVSLNIAAGSLLAFTRGVRLCERWGTQGLLGDRLLADRQALVLLRVPGVPYVLELAVGTCFWIAPSALVFTDGTVGLSLVRRQCSPQQSPWDECRLVGPGRVALCSRTGLLGRAGEE